MYTHTYMYYMIIQELILQKTLDKYSSTTPPGCNPSSVTRLPRGFLESSIPDHLLTCLFW